MIITATSAVNDGGMMFVDNPNQKVVATDVKVTDSEAA
jgi:hypothetical protein